MNYQEMNQEQLVEVILNQKEALKVSYKEHDKLMVLATIDGETGVFNKGTGRERLDLELANAKETGKNLVVAFVDFDNLKHVNTNYGHNEGDRYIANILNVVKGNIRGNDFIVRWGGDEFLLVFLGTTISKVGHAWSRVTAAVNGLNRKCEYNMNISYGFAEYDGKSSEEITLDELIYKADQEMYKCKNGRKKGI